MPGILTDLSDLRQNSTKHIRMAITWACTDSRFIGIRFGIIQSLIWFSMGRQKHKLFSSLSRGKSMIIYQLIHQRNSKYLLLHFDWNLSDGTRILKSNISACASRRQSQRYTADCFQNVSSFRSTCYNISIVHLGTRLATKSCQIDIGRGFCI